MWNLSTCSRVQGRSKVKEELEEGGNLKSCNYAHFHPSSMFRQGRFKQQEKAKENEQLACSRTSLSRKAAP
jgi:hypothetical protein